MPFCVFLYLYLETLKIDFSCVCYLSIAMQQITPSLAVKTTNVITSKFLGQKDRGELSWVFLTQSVSLSGSQACWLQAGLPGRPGPLTWLLAGAFPPRLPHSTALPYDMGAGFPRARNPKSTQYGSPVFCNLISKSTSCRLLFIKQISKSNGRRFSLRGGDCQKPEIAGTHFQGHLPLYV